MDSVLNRPIATAEKMPFVRKTYGWFAYTLGLGAVTAAVSFNLCLPYLASIFSGFTWLGIILVYMVLGFVFSRLVASENRTKAFLGMSAFAAMEGALFGPLIGLCFMMTGGLHLVGYALGVTAVMFGAMTALIFLTRADLTWMGGGLSVLTLAFIGVIVLGCIVGFGPIGSLLITGVGILLICGWTLYDTSKIVHHYSDGDEMIAATMLHIDFATLLWYVLLYMMQIFGGQGSA